LNTKYSTLPEEYHHLGWVLVALRAAIACTNYRTSPVTE